MTCSNPDAGRTGDAWTPGGGYEPVAGPGLHPCEEMSVKPLIYGYLRVWTDTTEQDAARTEHELTEYAEREGFTVAEIFIERPYLPVPAFTGLIQAIARTETKDIVIPDLSPFCPFHGLGETMKAILEHIAGARVWTIRP